MHNNFFCVNNFLVDQVLEIQTYMETCSLTIKKQMATYYGTLHMATKILKSFNAMFHISTFSFKNNYINS